MASQIIRRPLVAASRTTSTSSTTLAVRGHQTTARTKRSLVLPPHKSFTPSGESMDTIIYNPPSSAASVFHTPFKFLPKSDPRRQNNMQELFRTGPRLTEADMPPRLEVAVRGKTPSYHLTREDAREIQELRRTDPETWTIPKLAAKFNCSKVFVTICTQAPREYKDKLAKKLDVVKSRWGPRRTQAREDRVKRKEMLFRGDL
ncbi:hypothetical protein Cpir12675_005835 [Ceratocystis pirilliformis]|uniref:54S ribosomal protein L20 mitochondrial n=1 Tax=Ceratocystis pirilliformis TaxID=259994 RepID=A0ABR3YLY2_9PEZI